MHSEDSSMDSSEDSNHDFEQGLLIFVYYRLQIVSEVLRVDFERY